MLAHARHQSIADLVARKQRVTVQEIHRCLDVSPATLRRDLSEMEEAGLLVRVHGGAVHPRCISNGETSFSLRTREAVAAKRAIAQTASQLVPDGVTVYVDAGSTCLEIGRRLLSRSSLKIVTNSAPLLHEAYVAGVSVIMLGGDLRPISGAVTGILAERWLDELQIEWAFIGSSGLNADGVFTTELSEAAIKSSVLRHSRNRILAADSSKWDHPALVRFAEWNQFDSWLTDASLPECVADTINGKPGFKITRGSRHSEPKGSRGDGQTS